MPMTLYYSVNGRLLGECTNGVETTYMSDALGSTIGTVTTAGLQNRYLYSPYGVQLSKTGGAADPRFLWNGRSQYRVSVRLYAENYVEDRHLSSSSAQWTTRAAHWPREAPYGYVGQAPLSYIDKTGKYRIRPHPLPLRGAGIGGGYDYGSYCGPAVQENPGWHILPQDCIDACCLVHDRCLEAQYGAGLSEPEAHSCCDAGLGECAQRAVDLDCCESSALPIDCAWAATSISDRVSPPVGRSLVPAKLTM